MSVVIDGTTGIDTIEPTIVPAALNASGSAPVYAARAWVNFNGTGTVAIRASGNVSSITDNGTAWGSIGGGATGAGGDEVFVENSTSVTANYTISTDKNAMSVGPITVDSGVTVTVPSGSRWVVL